MESPDLSTETWEVIRANARTPEGEFGGFAEELAMSSLTEALFRDFRMSFAARPMKAYVEGRLALTLDVFAHSNDLDGPAVVVEVKSHLREEGLEQMRKILREFRTFFPAHAHRKVYGILAAVDAPDDLREQVLREGIYLARIHDGQFELQVPEGFQPRAF